MAIIEIELRSVFGNTLIYPTNDAAHTLAGIAGTKTLSPANLKSAIALGHEVVEKYCQSKLMALLGPSFKGK